MKRLLLVSHHPIDQAGGPAPRPRSFARHLPEHAVDLVKRRLALKGLSAEVSHGRRGIAPLRRRVLRPRLLVGRAASTPKTPKAIVGHPRCGRVLAAEGSADKVRTSYDEQITPGPIARLTGDALGWNLVVRGVKA